MLRKIVIVSARPTNSRSNSSFKIERAPVSSFQYMYPRIDTKQPYPVVEEVQPYVRFLHKSIPAIKTTPFDSYFEKLPF